jgi:hypothetical protein
VNLGLRRLRRVADELGSPAAKKTFMLGVGVLILSSCDAPLMSGVLVSRKSRAAAARCSFQCVVTPFTS